MTITDQITIVKRIAKAFIDETSWHSENVGNTDKQLLTVSIGKNMLAYRTTLELCGLTLNEIISLINADDLNVAVDELFSKSQTHAHK